MPGGRLTQEDRADIATGLAEGLTYAEIARRLDRPTSTISREVSRNGGSDGYRADWAHRAASRRARRGKPTDTSAGTATPRTDAPGRDSATLRRVEEQLATMMVRTGLPRMMANVLACLYVTDTGSFTAAELVRRLRVSPASISKAVAYLEAQELVRRERDNRRRRERYVIDDDVWFRAWEASARVNAELADVARHGADDLGVSSPAGARLEAVGQFLGYVSRDMFEQADRWRKAVRREHWPENTGVRRPAHRR